MTHRAPAPRLRALLILVMACLLLTPAAAAHAFTLRGKLKVPSEVDPTEFSIVAEGGGGEVRSARLSSKGAFVLKDVRAGDRYSVLRDANYYGPVLIAVKAGKKLYPYRKARKKGVCGGTNVQGGF